MREALKNRVVAVDDRPQIVETPGERAMPGARLVALSRIAPNPGQPRKHFDPHALDELAASVRERGIMQPLVVRPSGGGYTIVMGERRYRAALLVGLEEVPVVVRDVGDDQAYLDALIENLQREDLTDAEEAEAYRGLVARGLSVRKIAESLGIAASKVSRMIRVYEDEILSAAVIAGQVTKSQAQEMLVALPEEKRRLVQLATDRRERDEPFGLPELRREVGGPRRPGVALRNTPTDPPALSPSPAVEALRYATPEAGTPTPHADQEAAVEALRHATPGTGVPIPHGQMTVAAGRRQAQSLRRAMEARLPLLVPLAHDAEVSVELEEIRRMVLRAFETIEGQR